MENKQFKAESKRLLDLMINSIYTNKEIFLRELISNASDAIDKLYYRSLTDKKLKINKEDLKIRIDLDKDARILTITDNGCGMTEEELDKNLGTIAKSGSLEFKKEENEKKKDIDIIGQFGVGFYSAFMVSDLVKVESRSIDSDKAYCWTSKGVDGYKIEECDKEDIGTKVTLHIKEDSEEEKYSQFLEEYNIQELIRKYSDYIRYPIQMEIERSHKKEGTENEYEQAKELKTINSMTPIWKKDKKNVKEEEYESFYIEKFHDYEKPLKVIHTEVEGQYKYNALLYIPAHLPYDYYTKEYEKGLQLYANGVLIMERCEDLLPDYFGFVKGLVDSEDLSLNISREMLQHDRQLRVIAKNIENNIIIKSNDSSIPLDTDISTKIVDNLKLKEKLGTDNYISYDINLYSAAKNTKIEKLKNGLFEVSIPVPTKLEGKTLAIYYENSAGKLEEYEVVVNNGMATFKTNHFSVYTLSEKLEVKENNPKTGDQIMTWLSLGIISLIGLTGTLVYRKRYNK